MTHGLRVNSLAEPDEASKPSGARRLRLVSTVCTISLIVVFVVASVGLWDVGVQKTYPIKQAIEWNWRARATNNLVDMASYLNRSLSILEAFHGNPAWWFPTPDTDLDQIRLNIRESRDTALAVATNESIGSFGYQQAVQNLQETVVEINEHLELAKGWFVKTQAALVLGLLYLFLPLAGLITAILAYFRDTKEGAAATWPLVIVWSVGSVLVGIVALLIP